MQLPSRLRLISENNILCMLLLIGEVSFMCCSGFVLTYLSNIKGEQKHIHAIYIKLRTLKGD